MRVKTSGRSCAELELRLDGCWESLVTDLAHALARHMERAAVPGLAIAVVDDARVRWCRGLGVKDRESHEPVDADTMFEAASMSKPVFAYAVLQLCERGVLDLDTPLTRYTPERWLADDPRLDLITARHVLTHTAGFQNWRSAADPLAIHFRPGERWLYSGEGYSYLQSVVAHLTGVPLEAYAAANLFAPFGMASSGYLWDERCERRMARPHDRAGRPFANKKSTAADVARYGAAGALLTTAPDYARFLIEVIAPRASSGSGAHDRFRLTQHSLDEMLRPHVPVDPADGDASMSQALGWRLSHTPRGDIINHGGDNDGFHSFAVASRERRSGVVMLTNGENGGELLKELLVGELLTPFL